MRQGGCPAGPGSRADQRRAAGAKRAPRPDPSRRRVPHRVAPEQDCSLLPSAEGGWFDIERDGFSGPVKWGSGRWTLGITTVVTELRNAPGALVSASRVLLQEGNVFTPVFPRLTTSNFHGQLYQHRAVRVAGHQSA